MFKLKLLKLAPFQHVKSFTNTDYGITDALNKKQIRKLIS